MFVKLKTNTFETFANIKKKIILTKYFENIF